MGWISWGTVSMDWVVQGQRIKVQNDELFPSLCDALGLWFAEQLAKQQPPARSGSAQVSTPAK